MAIGCFGIILRITGTTRVKNNSLNNDQNLTKESLDNRPALESHGHQKIDNIAWALKPINGWWGYTANTGSCASCTGSDVFR